MRNRYVITAVLISSASLAHAAASSLILNPESYIYLTGNSTLHPYASTSTLTHVVAVLASTHNVEVQTFEVVIPVKGLKSGEAGLDKNLYKAMKSVEVSDIRFVLAHYEALPAPSEGALTFTAAGQLSIAGVQKDITLTGTTHASSDLLMVDGQYALRMSDYGIKPPKLLLGAIKVADPVVIHFHLKFVIQKGDIP